MAAARFETPSPESGYGRPIAGPRTYAAAVAITVAAVVSQYVVPQAIPALRPVYDNGVGDLLVVYGIPILAFLTLVGVGPLRRAFAHPLPATVQGLRWYGALSILSVVAVVTLAILYEALDPAALQFLQRANPALRSAATDPWFWVAFSFVIGAVEETIFRGWVFGYWLARGTASWELHALWTSALFAGVHVYYGLTYGPAAPIPYAELFLLGLAFAAIIRYSGGNLVAPALLHGAHDATAFLTLVNPFWANVLQWGLVGIGGLVALAYAIASEVPTRPPPDRAVAFSPPWDPYRYLGNPAPGQGPGEPLPPPPPPAPVGVPPGAGGPGGRGT